MIMSSELARVGCSRFLEVSLEYPVLNVKANYMQAISTVLRMTTRSRLGYSSLKVVNFLKLQQTPNNLFWERVFVYCNGISAWTRLVI